MCKAANCAAVVENRRAEYGMPVAELSRRSGIAEQSLRNTLAGTKKMTASELLALSRTLHLTFDDFLEPEGVANG